MKSTVVPRIKRFMDIIFGVLILAAHAPVILAIAIAVKLTSRGPVLYKQRRVGMLMDGGHAELFDVYKFRTMRVDAESGRGAVLAEENDPRVTRVGRFLRATRLDELPQLFNVLKGDMSIVGPRPERPELMQSLSLAIPFFEERLRQVKPGITGLAQVRLKYDGDTGPGEELARLKSSLVNPYRLRELDGSTADGMRLKMLYDLAYAASQERLRSSLLTDLGIMLKTPIVMFIRRTGR